MFVERVRCEVDVNLEDVLCEATVEDFLQMIRGDWVDELIRYAVPEAPFNEKVFLKEMIEVISSFTPETLRKLKFMAEGALMNLDRELKTLEVSDET